MWDISFAIGIDVVCFLCSSLQMHSEGVQVLVLVLWLMSLSLDQIKNPLFICHLSIVSILQIPSLLHVNQWNVLVVVLFY